MTLPIIRRFFVTLTGTMKRANALGRNTPFKYSFQKGKIRVDRNYFSPFVPQNERYSSYFKISLEILLACLDTLVDISVFL